MAIHQLQVTAPIMIPGSPACMARSLTPEQIEGVRRSARHCVDNARRFRAGLLRLDGAAHASESPHVGTA